MNWPLLPPVAAKAAAAVQVPPPPPGPSAAVLPTQEAASAFRDDHQTPSQPPPKLAYLPNTQHPTQQLYYWAEKTEYYQWQACARCAGGPG